MTISQENTPTTQLEQQKVSDKELNFRALESKYQKELERINAERERLQQQLEERNRQEQYQEDDQDPYVDNKKLAKHFSSFEKKLEEKIEKKAEEKARNLIEGQKKNDWIRDNPDFYDVLQQHAEKFAQKAPKLAESILRMPDTFERQQLVYNNIKAMGFDQPEQKQPSIQDKIDANKRSPYYQPSGVGSAPYAGAGDFSSSGQKNAYAKMQELKNRLRI